MLLAGLECAGQDLQGQYVEVGEGIAALRCQVGRLGHAVLFHADNEQFEHLDVGLLSHHEGKDIVLQAVIMLPAVLDQAHQREERNDSLVFVAQLESAQKRWYDLSWVLLLT